MQQLPPKPSSLRLRRLLRHGVLPMNVLSCKEAAHAKGIELSRELKSLIVASSQGTCVVHVKGDACACWRAVKRALNCREACLATGQIMRQLRLERGIVCPIIDPVWSMKHLIDVSLLEMSWVSTNDGTLRGYVMFDPHDLCGASLVHVGRFSDLT